MEFLTVQQNDQGRFEVIGLQDPGMEKIKLKGFAGYKPTCWERIKGWVLEHIFHKAVTINVSEKGDKLRVNCKSFAKCLDRMLGLGLDLSKKYDAKWVKQQIPLVKAQIAVLAERGEKAKDPMPQIGGNGLARGLLPWERAGVEDLVKSLKGGEFQATLSEYIQCGEENRMKGEFQSGSFEIALFPKGHNFITGQVGDKEIAQGMEKGCYYFENFEYGRKNKVVGLDWKLVDEFLKTDSKERKEEIQTLVSEQMKRAVNAFKGIEEVKVEEVKIPMPKMGGIGIAGRGLLDWEKAEVEGVFKAMRGSAFEETLDAYIKICEAKKFEDGKFEISLYPKGHRFEDKEITKNMEEGCYYFENYVNERLDKVVGLDWKLVKEFHKTDSEDRKKEIQGLVVEQMRRAIEAQNPKKEDEIPKAENGKLNFRGPNGDLSAEDLKRVKNFLFQLKENKSIANEDLEKLVKSDVNIVLYPELHDFYDKKIREAMLPGCYFFEDPIQKHLELSINETLVNEFNKGDALKNEAIGNFVGEQIKRAIEAQNPKKEDEVPKIEKGKLNFRGSEKDIDSLKNFFFQMKEKKLINADDLENLLKCEINVVLYPEDHDHKAEMNKQMMSGCYFFEEYRELAIDAILINEFKKEDAIQNGEIGDIIGEQIKRAIEFNKK